MFFLEVPLDFNAYMVWMGWYNLEPHEKGLATFVSDFLTLTDYEAP